RSSTSASDRSRTRRAGAPSHSVRGGTTVRGVTSAPAPTNADSPMSAPSRTVARIPIKAPRRTVAPWTIAPCPSVTSSSRTVGYFSCVTWIAQLSWMFERSPTRMKWQSPRTTELYQTDTSSPRTTSPITAAVSARYTLSPSCGAFPAYSRTRPMKTGNLARGACRTASGREIQIAQEPGVSRVRTHGIQHRPDFEPVRDGLRPFLDALAQKLECAILFRESRVDDRIEEWRHVSGLRDLAQFRQHPLGVAPAPGQRVGGSQLRQDDRPRTEPGRGLEFAHRGRVVPLLVERVSTKEVGHPEPGCELESLPELFL